MPSEQTPSSNSTPARRGTSEKGQHPPIISGVRALLGLPMHAGGVHSAASLTAAPRGHHYGQPLLLVSEENDEGFPEEARYEGLIEERARAGADARNDFLRLSPREGASLSRAIPENPAHARPAAAKMPAEQREPTSVVIPGVSTRRTEFAAFSHTTDQAKVTQPAKALEPSPDKAAPLHAPAALPQPRERTRFASEFLSRLEHLVTEDAKVQRSAEVQRPAMVSRSPSPVEQVGVGNGERGDTDVARRLMQLQRTVNELAATVSAQAAHLRDERQAQGRERKTPPQRLVVVQRGDASSTTSCAFWERSRLGRWQLRTGR